MFRGLIQPAFFGTLSPSRHKKVKRVRSYIARHPVRRTAQSALHFTPWQTCSYIARHPVRRTAQSALHFTPWQTCYFTLHPLADLLLYTSPPGKPVTLHFTPDRPVTLHFTPWQTCSYIARHPVRRTAQRALHFTPWQTCYFTLHLLADLLLYTSPPGRPVTLHFTPWQTCDFTLHPLADLLLYTSPPGRPATLHFTPWQTCSFQGHQLREYYSLTFPPLSVLPGTQLYI